ncbi:hypothetical protein AXX16_4011 [Serratia rubidaea]|nr:hypothetical protein AXX16_4011 [Serratia rubidaea]
MGLFSGFVKSLSKLSMIGRALMLPISLLPAAGIRRQIPSAADDERRRSDFR